ncbi:hypothetical protein [Nocardia sp. NPDC050793]|uniref:hypothetical protein n=1 Tax=Nocardia sp. NPDC050793 TaxID=3155159 RepID=UPI003411631E
MLMPDMNAPNYPHRFDFSSFTENAFVGLFQCIRELFESFGSKSISSVPEHPPVPEIAMDPKVLQRFKDYGGAAARLRSAYHNLREAEELILKSTTGQLAELSKAGKMAINTLVKSINGSASTAAPIGATQDQHMLDYITKGLTESEKAMHEALAQYSKVANQLPSNGDTKGNGNKPPQTDTGKPTSNPPTQTTNYDPPNISPQFPSYDHGTGGLGSGSTYPPSIASGSEPGASMPGMDMLSSMLPMMMQQAMARQAMDQEQADVGDLERRLRDGEGMDEPPAVTPAVTGPAQAKGSQPPAVSATPGQTPGGTPGSNTGTSSGSQNRPVAADGSVEYVFPDNRTQRVSLIVAQALDAAFGNRAGTDARAAYEKTSAKWVEGERPGEEADPYKLITGDVSTWEERTALVVVWGTEGVGNLELVADGELRAFANEMHDGDGDFGAWEGFAHPPGIEINAPATTTAVPPSSLSSPQDQPNGGPGQLSSDVAMPWV